MKCKNCGKQIEDDIEFCYYCGEPLSENDDDEAILEQEKKIVNSKELVKKTNSKIKLEEVEEVSEELSSEVGSTIGSAIKIISMIVMILACIGSFIMMEESVVLGITVLLLSLLVGLLSYGIGEIVCLLTAIKYKIK